MTSLSKIIVVCGLGAGALIYAYRRRDEIRQRVIAVLVCRKGDELRRAMQSKLTISGYRSPAGHSHGMAAGDRTRASNSIKTFIRQMGYEPYIISRSARDGGEEAWHGYYMPKDLVHPLERASVKDQSIITMIDVDYYVDMAHWMEFEKPIMLYTFVPLCVAGPVSNGSFTMINNEVVMDVDGGGSYRHQLWAYDTDWLMVHYWWGSLIYSVEQKQVDPHHRLVFLNPVSKVWTPLARWLLPGRTLQRREVALGRGVNRLDYHLKGEKWTSVGIEGASSSVELPTRVLEAITQRFKASKNPDVHTVERYLTQTGEKEDRQRSAESAPLLFQVLKLCPSWGIPKSKDLITAVGTIVSYQCVGSVSDGFSLSEEGKEFGRAVAAPLTDNPAVIPRLNLIWK